MRSSGSAQRLATKTGSEKPDKGSGGDDSFPYLPLTFRSHHL